MTLSSKRHSGSRTGFRGKLLVWMMLVVSAITALGLYVAQRNLAAEVEQELRARFQSELAALHNVQEARHAALAERCRALARKPRIHAALEDNALDLLYPSARDELRDVMSKGDPLPSSSTYTLHAEFYRFLDSKGAVISPPNGEEVGELTQEEEGQLALNKLPQEQQLGYLARSGGSQGKAVAELIAVPIISTETGESIAALVLGFKPVELGAKSPNEGMRSGIWVEGRLKLSSIADPGQAGLGETVTRAITHPDEAGKSLTVVVDAVPHLLFQNRLNPESLYPAAFEVCLFSLTDLLAQQRHLRWQILGAGALIWLVGFAASHFVSARLSVPVEKLAVDSEVNRAERERAETALEQTNVELQRSVRFSADASHQLKTPVAVLRAGLEELLAREDIPTGLREELAELTHQTYRLTGVIEDLLLLSRMDAGRLRLEFAAVDLTRLIEGELDDLGAQPETLELAIESDVPAGIQVVGERCYTVMIVRNLLENARKYNRPGGRIRIRVHEDGDRVVLIIGNTGRPISPAAREHIFDRFHRGAAGENIPGHGLGLNLARELARLHGGDVRLSRSDDEWTEFEVHFRVAKSSITAAKHS